MGILVEDQYRLKTSVNDAALKNSLDAATRKMSKFKMEQKNVAVASTKTKSKLQAISTAAKRMGATFRQAASASVFLGKGFVGAIRGGARLMGTFTRMIGVVGIVIGIFGALAARAISWLKGSEEASGGFEDVTEAAEETSSSVSEAATVTEEAAQKMQGSFGAFGAVGEGFLQRQGAVTQAAADNAKDAAAAASTAGDAIEEAETKVGSMGKAVSRLSKGWNRFRDTLRKALEKAAIPLVEKLADLLEDPRFIEFTELLADDLAEILAAIADIIIEDVIPAVLDFLEEVNEAGGPIEYFKKKWTELKNTVLMIFGIIIGKITQFSMWLQQKWSELQTGATFAWNIIKETAIGAFDAIKTAVSDLGEILKEPWDAMVTFIQGLGPKITQGFQSALSGVINILNDLIDAYNALADPLGLPTLRPISLGDYSQSETPTTPSPSPTSPSVPSAELRAAGTSSLVVQNLTIDASGNDPYAAGVTAARAFVNETNNLIQMRQSGRRLPA